MCIQQVLDNGSKKNIKKWQPFCYYMLAITFAAFSALSGITLLQNLGTVVADIFINMFKCISLPIIASSIVVTFTQYNAEASMSRIWRRTLMYTLTTTIIAATIACILYVLIKPAAITNLPPVTDVDILLGTTNYFSYLASLIPTNIFEPFIENKVISVLLLSILIGLATRNIQDQEVRHTISNIFKAGHEILLNITKWMVKIVPVGLYGFLTVSIMQFKNGVEIQGLAAYLAIIVLANLIQGFVILPAWLSFNGIKPFATMRGMLPALSMAFFSKSSAGTLPITIETAEKNLNIDSKLSRFVLPLCTTINMNGCAAFIFVTVIYVMQMHGIEISFITLFSWILISTVAAIGNAGIPMGCFFLSASLLSGMNMPITILGLILPLYSIIDMLETALNVWSDACVAKVVDHKEKVFVAEPNMILEQNT